MTMLVIATGRAEVRQQAQRKSRHGEEVVLIDKNRLEERKRIRHHTVIVAPCKNESRFRLTLYSFFERTLLRYLIQKRSSEIEGFPGIEFSHDFQRF